MPKTFQPWLSRRAGSRKISVRLPEGFEGAHRQQGLQILRAVGTHHFGSGKAKQREVVASYITQRLAPLHISGMGEGWCHQRGIDAKASREVHQQTLAIGMGTNQTSGQSSLVAPCLLAGALFHVEVRRINHPLTRNHLGNLHRAVCHPLIWSSAHGKSTLGFLSPTKAKRRISSSRWSRTNWRVASFFMLFGCLVRCSFDLHVTHYLFAKV